MDKLKAILVDDEESARDVLENLLQRFCPEVELLAKCDSIKSALVQIAKHEPDLVFLDIVMPDYAGYEIVKFFSDIKFQIIFVTAYDQYAIKAFEVSATDYLLKPIDITRLKSAIVRVKQQRNMQQQSERLTLLDNALQQREIRSIVISDKGQQHVIAIKSIIAIEAQESYCIIHTLDKKIVASKNLKHFEKLFDGLPHLLRVHKSWLINKEHLLNYSRSELTIRLNGGVLAKLSKYKKADFESAIAL
ncbi:MAG: LytTR family DNA-binding domain-containing protein [Bacteroidota bacterium]